MNIPFITENLLLIGAIILFFSLFWERISHRFEVPVLILFLGLGILVGMSGIEGLNFSSPKTARFIGMISLSIILFSGGMDAKFKEIKPIMFPSILLSTLGVVLTALITGVFVFWITHTFFTSLNFSFYESLLLASVVASTDFALVFAILHSSKLELKHKLRPLLEFESGSNDVMAYLLMITFMGLVTGESSSIWEALFLFFRELILGALGGFLLGKLAVKIINRVKMSNDALYPILLLAICIIIFLFTDLIKGSGYLAVYIGGLAIGNSRFIHKRSSKAFFNACAWLAQLLMFFIFGMLVDVTKLGPYALIGIVIGLFIIIFARPLAVWGCIFPFKKIPAKAKFYISWVGLRGAVPLIFATYLLTENVAQGQVMFYIILFIMLASLLVQGNTVAPVARFLGMNDDDPKEEKEITSALKISDSVKSAMTEITIKKDHLKEGNTVMTMQIPENTLVVMIKRKNRYFVPQGNTEIEEGDVLFVISDDEKSMRETYKKMGIKY